MSAEKVNETVAAMALLPDHIEKVLEAEDDIVGGEALRRRS